MRHQSEHGTRWDHALPPGIKSTKALQALEHNPRRSFGDLPDIGKQCLEDFVRFSEIFFRLRIPAWWRIAAGRRVEDVLSPDDALTLLHAPTGAGKTTLLETLVLWLMSGGGTMDPESGRALRFLFGSATLEKAVRSVDRIRRTIEDPRPYYDFRSKQQAEHSLLGVYGRYKPSPGEGDDTSVWQRGQFTVAQVGERGLFHKDPTIAAYSLGASPLSSRVDVAVVDDAALMRTIGDESLAERFETEFESRVEPGGALFVVGQRLAAGDLYGHLQARTWTDDAGEEHPVYDVVAFPAHFDDRCDGDTHAEWDGADSGCLLDEVRLPWSKLQRERAKPTYAAVYQQDIDATANSALIDPAWLDGGTDAAALETAGSYDRECEFGQRPAGIDVV